MTSHVKKYQNVSYKELIAYSEHNPNRHLSLEPIEIDIPKEDVTLHKLGLRGFTASTIHPSGILGACTCISDPNYYYLAALNVRTQLLIELTTDLQQKTDELKNTSLSRKRKKIYDSIGAAYNNGRFEDKEYNDLIHGIAYMLNIQFVLIKEAIQEHIENNETYDVNVKGEILFSSDPVNWKRDLPVWIIDYRGRWIALPVETDSVHSMVGVWLESMEQAGWTVQWPEADGTKTECVEKLSGLPSWDPADKKLSKELLAARLGRLTALTTLCAWAK